MVSDKTNKKVLKSSKKFKMPINIEQTYKRILSHHNSIISANIRSYQCNKLYLDDLIQKVKPTVICLTEMWSPYNPNISGYQRPIMSLRKKRRGGGVAAFITSEASYSTPNNINNIQTKYIEKIAINVEHRNQKTLIVTIYRPPKSKVKESLEEIEQVLIEAYKTSDKLIITGDFNFDLLHMDHNCKKYINLIQELQLTQLIDEPTRITSISKSCVDHVLISPKLANTNAWVINAHISDHLPLAICWKKGKKLLDEESDTKNIMVN